ncbi:hypothetical protein BBJ28_00009493 [Nothophytophthora sp. Chile5]|nr:hypothetical protein BBJ28_00009493 [Nothophytophthora sp. Chile5]
MRWHSAGLVFVGSIGFSSMLLLLCLVGEFVLGLRTLPKIRKAMDQGQFVELPQIDVLKESGNCEAPEEAAAMVEQLPAISEAVDPESLTHV